MNMNIMKRKRKDASCFIFYLFLLLLSLDDVLVDPVSSPNPRIAIIPYYQSWTLQYPNLN
jgi:hypothetical protein